MGNSENIKIAQTKEKVQPEILNVDTLLKKNLVIPDYQRPYKWSKKHTQQLLEDLLFHFEKGQVYRLGTVVIHKEDNKENIVDGQQRLTTLTILLYCLDKSRELGILKQNVKVSISQENIVNNKQVIQQFINDYIKDKKGAFIDYILEKCEFIYIPLDNIDEAFQFFDSQNARGKELAPYDLLKAYHLREMKADQQTTYRCVENWEKAVEAPIANLNKVISQTLFRLRRWNRFNKAEVFLHRHIDCFKGVNEDVNYPYLNHLKASNAVTTLYQLNPFLFNANFKKSIVQTNQTIINGKPFFDYIEHYCNTYLQLFDLENGYLKRKNMQEIFSRYEKDKSVLDFLNSYQGHHRAGDQYVRCLFECAVLRYYDKFGEEKLDLAIKRCFEWAYKIRLKQTAVYFRSIEKEAHDPSGLLFHLENAITPKQFFEYQVDTNYSVEFKSVEDIKVLLGKGEKND